MEILENERTPSPVSWHSDVVATLENTAEGQNVLFTYELKRQEVIDAVFSRKKTYVERFPEDDEMQARIARVFLKILESELAFFDHVFQGVYRLSRNRSEFFSKSRKLPELAMPESTVLLWDIDGTIAEGNHETFATIIRPAFLPLMELLAGAFPELRHGILTSRSQERLTEQLEDPEIGYTLVGIREIFEPEYVFSNDRFFMTNMWSKRDYYISEDESERVGYEEKVRSYVGICDMHPRTHFILIDDVLQQRFEDVGAGIAVRNTEVCGYEAGLES